MLEESYNMEKDGFKFTSPSIRINYGSILALQSRIARLDSSVLQGLAHSCVRLNWKAETITLLRHLMDDSRDN